MNIDLTNSPLSCVNERPVIIAGPCSGESLEQMLTTARELISNTKIDCFRAGVWKPRTRPGAYEGAGEIALEWLSEVKREFSIPVCCEIVTTEHAELALKYGIDVLWIGARTTVNPFSMQSLSDALAGSDVTVMVKNPVNPDLQLWIGALERLNGAGIKKLAAIHRGFSSFEDTYYRNSPKWDIAIELRTLYPNLPIICDPSHISGRRELVSMVAQRALDLDMQGLMVEVHCNPSVALSDARQQLTPQDFGVMLNNLRYSMVEASGSDGQNILKKYRSEIDILDDIILEKLAKRMNVVRNIGIYKRDNNVKVLQVNRWERLLEDRIKSGGDMGLDPKFIRAILSLTHQESIDIQTSIISTTKKDDFEA